MPDFLIREKPLQITAVQQPNFVHKRHTILPGWAGDQTLYGKIAQKKSLDSTGQPVNKGYDVIASISDIAL